MAGGEPFVRIGFAQAALLDADCLRPIDSRPFRHTFFSLLQVISYQLMTVKQRDRGTQERFHPKRWRACRVIKGNPGADCLFHDERVVLNGEHSHGMRVKGGDLMNAMESLAVGTDLFQTHDGQPGIGGEPARFASSSAGRTFT